jgi:Tfp pilus assembly protein PilF
MTARNRRSLLSFALLVCSLGACAGGTGQRTQDAANAHYRMANAALQQAGGIQNEVNRRAAYPELSEAIKLDPKNARYRLMLGTLYLYNQDYPAAERETLRALDLDPSLADAHNNLGLVYYAQDRFSEAATQFRKALENLSYPTPEYAAYNLGRVYFKLGDYAAATEAYERSLAILPNNPDGRFELGMSYARLGRLAKAEEEFTAALKLRPDSARTRYELGMVLFKLGRRGEAAAQFRRVVELDPAGELGEQSRTYLKLLK